MINVLKYPRKFLTVNMHVSITGTFVQDKVYSLQFNASKLVVHCQETVRSFTLNIPVYLVHVHLHSVGPEMELSFHDGTVRDMVFMQDTINRSSLLISGGAGDCKIYVTDCETGMPVRAMAGHSGTKSQTKKIYVHVLYNCTCFVGT